MNIIPAVILFACISSLFLSSPASADPRLPTPSAIRNLNKRNPELLQLKKLLDENKIIPFYQKADKMLKEASLYRKKMSHPRNSPTGSSCAI